MLDALDLISRIYRVIAALPGGFSPWILLLLLVVTLAAVVLVVVIKVCLHIIEGIVQTITEEMVRNWFGKHIHHHPTQPTVITSAPAPTQKPRASGNRDANVAVLVQRLFILLVSIAIWMVLHFWDDDDDDQVHPSA